MTVELETPSKSDLTREHLRRVATRIFAAHGFEGTKVQMIAEAAAINKERIYAYFGDKEGLYQTVVTGAYEGLVASEAPLLQIEEKDAKRLTEVLVRTYFTFHEMQPEFSRILAWTNLESNQASRHFGKARQPILEHFGKIYHHGQRTGVFPKKVSFKTWFFSVNALVFFYFSNRKTMGYTLGVDLRKPDTTETMIQELIALLSRGVD